MADDVSGLAAELNESAARSERDRNARVDQAAAEHARRFADAELAAARLNDAAREVARAASESMPETTTTKRFMRSPKVVTAYRSSFFLDHVKLTPYFEYHRVSIDVRDGFAMRWNDPDARDRGGVTSVLALLTDSPSSAGMLQRLLANFMAEHGIRLNT
jgi:hypothetical protein